MHVNNNNIEQLLKTKNRTTFCRRHYGIRIHRQKQTHARHAHKYTGKRLQFHRIVIQNIYRIYIIRQMVCKFCNRKQTHTITNRVTVCFCACLCERREKKREQNLIVKTKWIAIVSFSSNVRAIATNVKDRKKTWKTSQRCNNRMIKSIFRVNANFAFDITGKVTFTVERNGHFFLNLICQQQIKLTR